MYDIRISPGDPTVVLDTLTPAYPFSLPASHGSLPSHRFQVYLLRTDSLALYGITLDTRLRRWTLTRIQHIDRRPVSVQVDDLNGDGLEDLILVDDEEPGMLPLFQQSNGSWRKGRVIAPDLTIGQVATLHLNNDGLLDILAYDWVHAQIHLIYGVGKERFLDQGGFPVDGPVDRMFIDPVSDHHPLRVTLLDKARTALTYLEMDDRGDLVEVSRQSITDSVRNVHAVHEDSTFHASFITVGDSSVGIIRDAFVAQSPTLNAVGLPGRVTASFVTDGLSVSLLLDYHRYCTVWRFGVDRPRSDSILLAVPPRPVAVIVRDQNGDGRDDLSFVSGRSGSISFTWGRADGTFSGVEEFSGPPAPRTVIGQAFPDGLTRFYATHDMPMSVTVTEIEWPDQTVTTSRIPVPGTTELIGEVRMASGSSALSAIHRASDRRVTFATYERIRQDSFLEQTLDLSPPSVLFGASVGFVDQDSIPDAILIYRPDDSSAVTLNVSYGDTSAGLHRTPVGWELPVRDPRVTYIWETDVNNDSLPDIIAVFPRTAQEIYAMLSSPDSLYANTVLIDSLVAVDERQHFAVYDVNDDALPDLFAIVGGRGGLGWWRNAGAGVFEPWELLVAAPDISGFAFGSFFEPSGNDLVIVRSAMNVAIVYSRDMLPWGSR